MARMSHITIWCNQSTSAANLEPGSRKYHSSAYAEPQIPSPARPARAWMTFVPRMLLVPRIRSAVSFAARRQTARACPRPGAAPAQAVPAPPPAVHFVAPRLLRLSDFHRQAPRFQLDSLIVRRAPRVHHVSRAEQQHLQARERQHQPRAGNCEARADRDHHARQRRERAGESSRRNRAVALEDQAELAGVFAAL